MLYIKTNCFNPFILDLEDLPMYVSLAPVKTSSISIYSVELHSILLFVCKLDALSTETLVIAKESIHIFDEKIIEWHVSILSSFKNDFDTEIMLISINWSLLNLS